MLAAAETTKPSRPDHAIEAVSSPQIGAPQGTIDTTDPDSRLVKGTRGWLQGYNAQAATNEGQIVIAAEAQTGRAGLTTALPRVVISAADRSWPQTSATEHGPCRVNRDRPPPYERGAAAAGVS